MPSDAGAASVATGLALAVMGLVAVELAARAAVRARTAALIADVIDGLAADPHDNAKTERRVRAKVRALCRDFPIYPNLG